VLLSRANPLITTASRVVVSPNARIQSMSTQHIVEDGDCIDSIAKQYGFFADTLWTLGDNQALRDKRKDQNILLPGDVVVVPDLRLKNCPGSTEVRHRFRRKGVPARLRLKFYRPVPPKPGAAAAAGGYDPAQYQPAPPSQAGGYEPIANARYVLTVDGISSQGQSDGQGLVSVRIPPDAAGGSIRFNPGMPDEITYDLALGGMDPVDTTIGVRKRLNNLGYVCLPEGDDPDDSLKEALQRFQGDNGLTANGNIDQATKDKLKDVHGS
jgi:hypothetical protein